MTDNNLTKHQIAFQKRYAGVAARSYTSTAKDKADAKVRNDIADLLEKRAFNELYNSIQ